ncbi:nucleotidyl transferase AbiEii/AbiGii toxin family protein [Ruania rhizosphaerae]|uniref:nucleotidyl transferase AbiEii/AbiGii toxin family protein n=1 Tax=Ruania rhizosphaerae TaxID=1840413 RepID=UPI00135ADFB4|nr:nucleotidyl transferase AbiEii/AbiGii toxin family protein [Ruania rhizosphaerae]
MQEFHERIARPALTAAAEFGFVLAGGYALSANGIGDRPSEDVDLFTNRFDPETFRSALARVCDALTGAGFDVTDDLRGPTFADVHVRDAATGETVSIQLGVNYREFPPAQIQIGPVLDVRDAVAGKMSALWSRGEVRDFIDIYSVLESGTFTREEVLALGDQQEATPMDRRMLAQRFRMPHDASERGKYGPRQFALYGIDARARAALIDRFSRWAREIDPSPEHNAVEDRT